MKEIEKLRGEERITETVDEQGQKVRVKELFVEQQNPVHLRERVTEKLREDVYERIIETVDEKGNVIEQRVEAVDQPKLQVVEHIATEPKENANISREEMVELFVQAVQAVRKETPAAIASKGLQAELEDKPKKKFDWLLITLGVVVAIEMILFLIYMF